MMIFRISDIDLYFHVDKEVRITDNFKPFFNCCSDGENIYDIYIQETIDFPLIKGKTLFTGDCYQVIEMKSKLVKVFFEIGHMENLYAVGFYDFNNKKINIYYKENGEKHFSEIGNCFYHISWEALLIRQKKMIFHSCCLQTEYGGILFSGNSGIGKSTQGDLWIKYQNAKMINGDRTILHLESKHVWKGYGSPYAGSSRCYKNECTDIKVIVFLKQAKDCSIRQLSGIEAYKNIYSQLTINDWDKNYVLKVCDLVEKMINDLKIYELACTPDKLAVDLLAETLKEDDDERND